MKRKTKAELQAEYEAFLAIEKDNARKYKSEIRALHKLIGRLEKEKDAYLDISDQVHRKPLEIKKSTKKGGVNRATMVLALSDWHVEEEVQSSAVNEANFYTPQEAKRRAENVFQNAVTILDGHRRGWSMKIDQMVMPLLGDFFSGWIHEDLKLTNLKTPQEAILFVYELLCGGIDFLLQEAGLRRIVMPAHYGNHGRSTVKKSHAAGARTSWETMIYRLLAKRYANEDRVEFRIAEGPWLYTKIYDHVLRTGHGDECGGGGGVGGILVPLRRLILMNLNNHINADTTLVGHWHQEVWDRAIVVNNSLIGQTVYGMRFSSATRPSQTSFLINEKTSERCGYYPIWALRS